MLSIRPEQLAALAAPQEARFVDSLAEQLGAPHAQVAEAVGRALALGLETETDVARWVGWTLRLGPALEQEPEVAALLAHPGLDAEAKLDEIELWLATLPHTRSPAACRAR
jgi:hypothetical protein